MPVSYLLVLSALLFSIGIYGVLARQNAVLVLLSIELMLNAVNINLVAFSALLPAVGVSGQVFALFVIAVAAAEVGVGLSIVILIYRNRQSVDVDELSLMKW
jgi:NADH:ubiquinone oxidoreductase subunit K